MKMFFIIFKGLQPLLPARIDVKSAKKSKKVGSWRDSRNFFLFVVLFAPQARKTLLEVPKWHYKP